MTYSAQRGDVEISRTHNVALRKEIGERLGISLDLQPPQMSPHLAMLVTRLALSSLTRLSYHAANPATK
jgi:hypothetical protein